MDEAKHDDHDGAPDEHATQDGQRHDEASGLKVGPPGQGDLDPDALAEGEEQLRKAGGGH